MKFLLVEDDEMLASAIRQLLSQHHYVMDLATDGLMGRNMAEAFPYDLILLDWALPKLEGVQLCKYLRNAGNHTPIILLTARNDNLDRVAGLDAGADDYLVKPFEFEELLARIRALLRRAEGIVSPILQWGDLHLDPRSSEVTCGGVPIALTPKEYALLELFLRNPSRIFSLDNLLDKVWPFEESPNVGAVRTHIKGLRQKLKKAGLPDIISTVYGLGYRLKSTDSFKSDAFKSPNTKMNELTFATSGAAFGEVPEDISKINSNHESVGKQALASLWQSVSKRYIQRVADLATILRALQPGLVDKAIQQQVLSEVHALTGSLGSFSFKSVTAQCQEIESIFRTNAHLGIQHIRQLETLITQVQKTLERGLPTPAIAATLPQPAGSISAVKSVITPAELRPGQLFQLLLVESRFDACKEMFGKRDEHWLQSLQMTAARHQMQVSAVGDIDQARQIIFDENRAEGTLPRPNLVVFDFGERDDLPNNDSTELKLLADLQTAQPPIPAIVLTAAASFENRVRVARLGVAGLLQTPVTPTEVLETATQVFQKGAPPDAKLLIVDDDPAMLTLLQSLLQPWGCRLQLLSDPHNFWQMLERFDPDLVLLDVKMPEFSGFDLCQVMRNAPRWYETPILFMSSSTDAETIQQVFSVRADDYIRKPIVAPELVARVLGWLERSRTRQLMADVDSLTGVTNRRKSTQLLTRLLGLAQRQGEILCFALIDFDHFKQINDEHGHPMGDHVLRRFGESLRVTFRREDVVGRWGGEEFVVGLYGISDQEGVQRLRQFLKMWQQETFPCNEHALAVTFTAGVAVYPHHGTDLQELYRAADEALYRAKAAGRNRIYSAI